MNGLGRLPKHTSEYADGVASANWIKRLWWRYSHSAQRASPPPRILLVVLLSAQILFLAIVRLGPAASIRTSSSSGSPPSSSFSSSLLVGTTARIIPPLKFLPQENQESPALLHEERKPPSSSSSSSSSSSDFNDGTLTNKDDDPPSSDEQNPLFQTSSAAATATADQTSAVAAEQASPSKKKSISKKKHISKKKRRPKKTPISNKEDTPPSVSLEEEGSNVPSLDEQKVVDLLPSVEDKFLTEPASNRASPIDSEDKSGALEEKASLIDTFSPTIEDKGAQEEATIVQGEAELSAEAQNEAVATSSSETEAQSEPVVKEEQVLIAEKASEVATEAEAQSEPVLQEEQAFSAEKTPIITEATDDLLPSVEDKFLPEPASVLEEKSSLIDTFSPTIEDKGEPVVKEEQVLIAEKATEAATEAEAQSEPTITEATDDLLPSVEDKFLTEPGSNGASPIDSEDKSGVLDEKVSLIDTSSTTIEDKGVQEEVRIVQTETDLSAEAQNEVMSTSSSETEAQSEPVMKEEQAIAEKASEVATEAEAQSEPGVQEEQEFSAKKVSETVTSTEIQAEKGPMVKEEQTLIAEKVSEEAAVSSENEAQSLPVFKEEQTLIAQKVNEGTSSSQCGYGYIYVYDLPPIFNHDTIANCSALNPWLDVCPTLLNGGLGESLGDASPLGQTGSWYVSDQFTAEVVFHNRILQHPCLTDKPELASSFYVPFYAGLDVGRYLWSGFSAERRDRVSKQLLEWLGEQQAWKRNGGWDHFLMIGRITWDFRRSKDEDWGSGLFYNPSMQNITRLLIERNPWDDKEMAVPYPTNFHPLSDADLVAWQNHIRSLKRTSLFSFAGASRKRFPDDFRGILLEQCHQAESCQSLDCSNRTCDNNQKTLELFMDSTFCLQPRGDSFTRRSTFDCLLAGSIPVFFWHRSAYLQYKWHLPADEASYSVFISKHDMRNGTKIEEVLKALSPEKVQSMQEAVIQMIPRMVYAVSGFSLKEEKDAFDVAIEGVMRRFKELSLSSER